VIDDLKKDILISIDAPRKKKINKRNKNMR